MPDGSGTVIKRRLQEGGISREAKALKSISAFLQKEKRLNGASKRNQVGFRLLGLTSAHNLCLCAHVFHRYLHPEGLPSEYTISMMLRLLPETPQEPFALWEILDKHNQPLVGLILDSTFDGPVLFINISGLKSFENESMLDRLADDGFMSFF